MSIGVIKSNEIYHENIKKNRINNSTLVIKNKEVNRINKIPCESGENSSSKHVGLFNCEEFAVRTCLWTCK